MPSHPRKLLLAALVALAALALSACGDSHSKVSTGTYAGESGANAPYLDVGPLKYEVQLSRQLNPANIEDAAYLRGLTPAQQRLAPGQEWFGVFLQVYNTGSAPARAATGIAIYDTQGNVYSPLLLGPANEYAYRGGLLPGKGVLPEAGSTAFWGPTQGAVLVFKIQTVSLDNRPLEVKISNPVDLAESARAELDV
jgi:hypothetical protein